MPTTLTSTAEELTLTLREIQKSPSLATWRKALQQIKANPSLLDPDEEERLFLWSLDKDGRTFRRVGRLLCALISPDNQYLINHVLVVPKGASFWMTSSDNPQTYTPFQFERATALRGILDRSFARRSARGLFKEWGKKAIQPETQP